MRAPIISSWGGQDKLDEVQDVRQQRHKIQTFEMFLKNIPNSNRSLLEGMALRTHEYHNHVIAQTAQAFVTSFLTRCLYRHSHKRLLLVDLKGALWHRDISRESLQRVAFNPPAEIFDGLPVKNVLDQIAQKVPKIGIVAENGCFIKTRPSQGQPPAWINMVANFNLTWKSSCLEILDYFTERTPGAFVEEREASIVWRFWTGPETDSPDRQWARRQAAEAQNHIFDSLGERYGLRIIPGNNSFLVLPNNISRSTAVGAILHPGGPSHSPLAAQAVWMSPDTMDDNAGLDLDCILAVSSDEKLLRRLNEFDNSETVSTSGKNTDAKWQLDAKIATKALWQLANVVSA
ncbi:glycosyltransferase 20 family protein [Pleurotus pulmonarius]